MRPSPPRPGMWLVMAPLLALSLLIRPARASELEELNPDLSSQLFLKILAYDRSLQARSGGKLVLAIVYRPEREESERARAVLQTAFQERANKGTIQGMTLSVTAVAYEARTLIKRLQGAGATLLYVTAGLEDQAAVITAAAQALHAPTMTGHRSLLEAGMAIAVVTKDDRPGIVINLPVTKTLGMDLDPTLLRLSEVRR